MKRYGLWSVLAALALSACGNGGVKSPDFESVETLQSIHLSIVSGTPDSDTSLGNGDTLQLQAVGTFQRTLPPPDDVSDPYTRVLDDASWSSSAPAAISVSATGLATGGTQAVNNVVITASKDGKSDSITLDSRGAELLGIVVTPQTRTVGKNATQSFTALGQYYGTDTPQPLNGTVTWTSDDTTVAVIQSADGNTAVAKALNKIGSAHIVATLGEMNGQATLRVANLQLQSLVVTPSTASVARGNSVQFSALATFGLDDGESVTQPVDANWAATASVATLTEADTTSCASVNGMNGPCVIAKGVGAGQSTAVTATYTDPNDASTTKTASATLNVTPGVLNSLVVTPETASIPKGSKQTFTAQGIYSDSDGAAVDLREGDSVSWMSSSTAIATVSPATGATTQATGQGVGTATITATSGTLTDSATLTVREAEVQSLLRIEPPSATTTVNRKQEFQVIGTYTDGSEQPVADSLVDWATADTGIATIDAQGVATGVAIGTTQVTATRKGTTDSKSATLRVTDEVCNTPLEAANGASTSTEVTPLCLLCGVTNPDNAIDADLSNFAGVAVPVGLADNSAALIVSATDHPPLYTTPFPAGSEPGFVISRPNGPLVLAELLSQIEVSTLLGGATQESSGSVIPLRLDLLGLPLTGNVEQGLVTIKASLPYDAIRLRMKSGAASALTGVRVLGACATTLPPVTAVPLEHVAGISPGSATIEVGKTLAFTANGYYQDEATRELQNADIDWTSSNPGIATVDANGVVTALSIGKTTIRGTLKAGVAPDVTGADRYAEAELTVETAACTTRWTAAGMATVAESTGGICLLCSISDLSNVIDNYDQTAATINVTAGLLGASKSITVTAKSQQAGGQSAGFLISRPAGSLVSAELLSQVTVSTLLDGEVQESTAGIVPLRLDLLGVELTTNSDVAMASVKTSTDKPFNGLRLTFNSGVATLLSSLQVNSACAVATLPSDTP